MAKQGQFPYRQIVEAIRAEILAGTRAPGERLPSENELAGFYKTSRPTVRRALARLKADGLIVTEQGRGAFVRPKPHVRLLLTGGNYRKHRSLGLPGFNAQVLEQGQSPEQRLLNVTTVPAAPEIALRLDIDEGAGVVLRQRIFLIDGHPVALCDSYYPADLARGTAIAEHRKIKGGVHALIEDVDGPIKRMISRSIDEIAARMPTPSESDALHLTPGTPVARILRTVYDSEDHPVEVQDTVATADRHEFRYEVSMSDNRHGNS